jgi:hypothetical protein
MTLMSRTDDLLAEIADLEVPVPEIVRAQEVAPPATPSIVHTKVIEPHTDLDERGHKILALTDLVIQEFDRAVEALTTVKDAVKALREELSAPSAPALVEDATPETSEEVEGPDASYSAPVVHNPQGESDSMDNISITL